MRRDSTTPLARYAMTENPGDDDPYDLPGIAKGETHLGDPLGFHQHEPGSEEKEGCVAEAGPIRNEVNKKDQGK